MMRSTKTLLLNASYEPLSVIGWRKAIVLLVARKVDVVEDTHVVVRSPSTSMTVPSVVRLTCRVPFRRLAARLNRRNLLVRDEHRCQYCGVRLSAARASIDHVVPRSRGGAWSWNNLVVACFECNQAKRDRTPEEAGLALARRPRRPVWLSSMGIVGGDEVKAVWRPYLFL